MRGRLARVRSQNTQMREDMAHYQGGNDLLRKTLQALLPKLDLAKEFVVESLRATDVSSSERLQVLAKPKARPTLSRLLESVDSNPDASSILLQLNAPASDDNFGHVISKNTDQMSEMVGGLMERLKDIEREAQDSEMTFRDSWKKQYTEGEGRRAEMIAERKDMNSSLNEAEDTHHRLKDAYRFLSDMRQEYMVRLRGLNEFAVQLSKTATSVMEIVKAGVIPSVDRKAPTTISTTASTTKTTTTTIPTTTTKPTTTTIPTTTTTTTTRTPRTSTTSTTSMTRISAVAEVTTTGPATYKGEIFLHKNNQKVSEAEMSGGSVNTHGGKTYNNSSNKGTSDRGTSSTVNSGNAQERTNAFTQVQAGGVPLANKASRQSADSPGPAATDLYRTSGQHKKPNATSPIALAAGTRVEKHTPNGYEGKSRSVLLAEGVTNKTAKTENTSDTKSAANGSAVTLSVAAQPPEAPLKAKRSWMSWR